MKKLTEDEMWQNMMRSCRKACKILRVDFKEPEYLNWNKGRSYYNAVWHLVNLNRKNNGYKQI